MNARRPTNYPSRFTFYVLLVILLSLALRMARVGELRMWGDEAYSVYSANRTLAAITFEGAENDPHPPLYYYLLHFYLPLAGASELSVRFFSVFPGVATLALLYAIGKRLFNPRVGLLAAALAAIAPFHIYYSQEIRMYALAIFLTTLATYFFVRLSPSPVRDGGGPGWGWFSPSPVHDGGGPGWGWLAYALTTLLALYTVYQSALVLLAQGLFVLTLWRTRRVFVLRWFAVAFGVVALFLPWLLFRFSSTLGHLEDRAGQTIQSLPVFVARGFAALTVGPTIPPSNALMLAVVFALLVIAGLFVALRTRQAQRGDGLVFALAFVPLIAVYPLYLLLPILVARLFALAFVPLALLLARSISLLDRRAAVPFALAMVAISAFSLNDYNFRFDRYNPAAEDYIPIIRAVEQQARPGDVVLFHAYWHMGYFQSHYRGAPVQYLELDKQDNLALAVSQSRTVWAVVQDFAQHGSEFWLAQNAFPVGEQKFGQLRLSSFRVGTPESGNVFAEPVVFGNGIALLGYRYNREPLESGRGLATIQLDWQANQKIADDYTVSVRLTNPRGALRGPIIWAQADTQPASGTKRTSEWQPNEIVQDRHAFVIPAGTPRGEYAIQVVMYESQSGRPVPIVAPENMRGQAVEAGNLAIIKP
ncbi:MAG: glycosyltransferase family 39 protein, partial [Chloroflexi bacterium]|nr:glycosyltransferase family 39 protein [Chloroflexota bacterium]